MNIKNLILALSASVMMASAEPTTITPEMLSVTYSPVVAIPGIQPNWTVQLPSNLENTTDITPEELATEFPTTAFNFTTNVFTGGPLILYLGQAYDDPEKWVVETTPAEPWNVPDEPFGGSQPSLTCEELGTCKTPPTCQQLGDCQSPPPVPEPKSESVIVPGIIIAAAVFRGHLTHRR